MPSKIYGLPLLFPPNRIHGGSYCFQGRVYHFPINEPGRNSHLHGVLSSQAFTPQGDGAFLYRATATAAAPYLMFPHAFTVERRYALDERGLTHWLTVVNDSPLDMPLGVGIHAAWQVPSPAARLRIPVKEQWLVDPYTIVPTGQRLADDPVLAALRQGALCPEGQPLSHLLACDPGSIRLEDGGRAFCFESDPQMPFCMLWNGGGQGFVCPEPQSWLVDAPNLPWPLEQTGFGYLRPGEGRTYTLRYYVEA